MTTYTNFLVKPVSATPIGQIDRRRQPRSGPMVNDPKTVEIRNIKKNQVTMTTRQFAVALTEFDGIHTSSETLQAYMQGYIGSSEMIEVMLQRCRSFVEHQRPEAKRFANMSMVEIIEDWFSRAGIDRDGVECKWRKLAKILQKDHSTIFRWYKENRKPRSLDTVLALNQVLEEHVNGVPEKRARKASAKST